MVSADLQSLADAVRAGERPALARAVTLVESTRPDHRADANALLDELSAGSQNAKPTIRIGLSGTPGVGKSTFIEALGLHLVDAGHRVAVLAVDPSSARTGGSILGDKTRMAQLVQRPEAYIRPTAAMGNLGGVARRTAEVIQLTEAAGYDVVLVETVGVGQSEAAVADITDLFVLLVAPAGGDDLQGIKRGVMELIDVLVVNKADGDLTSTANHTASDYGNALSLLRPRRGTTPPPVLQCSALEHRGIAEVWNAVETTWSELVASGQLDTIRAEQRLGTLDRGVKDALISALEQGSAIEPERLALEEAVRSGARSPASAAAELAARILSQR